MPYRIIDDRSNMPIGGKNYPTKHSAEGEILRWQHRWDEHGGDSGLTLEQILHAKPVHVIYWKVVNPDGSRASFGSWHSQEAATDAIEGWKRRAIQGGRPDIPMEKLEKLTVAVDAE